jgi:hypothetical protein
MSLYLMKEAGALLASGATAGAFLGSDASPPFMPRLPWDLRTMNRPPYLATPPLTTRIPPGTPPPPSPYRGEAGMLGDAGSPVPPETSFTQAQWDALPPATQSAILQEIGVRSGTTPAQLQSRAGPAQPAALPPAAIPPSTATGCPPGYINLGGGEFPNNCVPAPGGAPPRPHVVPMPRLGGGAPALPPPAIYSPPPRPPSPTLDTSPSPSGGGGGGGDGGMPWGPILAAGGVLALLYAGRKKKGRRR